MAPATIRARQLPVRRFAARLAEESEIGAVPFLGLRSPKLDVKVVEPLDDDQLRRLIAACQPPTGATPQVALRHRLDQAIVRLMLETGARAGEVVALSLGDLDLAAGTAVIRRSKGGIGRVVPVGPHAAKALDRYLRLRRYHRFGPTSPALWLGDRGKQFSYDAHKSLGERATARAASLWGHPRSLVPGVENDGSRRAAKLEEVLVVLAGGVAGDVPRHLRCVTSGCHDNREHRDRAGPQRREGAN